MQKRDGYWFIAWIIAVPLLYLLLRVAYRGFVLPLDIFDTSASEIVLMHVLNPIRLLNEFFLRFPNNVYFPLVFWIFLWGRQRYTSVGFTKTQMGWITIFLGLFLLGCSAFFNDYRPGTPFNLFYGTGWCFLFTGFICLPASLPWSERLHMGKIACVAGLGWIGFGLSKITIGSSSIGLLLVDMGSLIACIFGLLSSKRPDRSTP